jgi:hypothetical protein
MEPNAFLSALTLLLPVATLLIGWFGNDWLARRQEVRRHAREQIERRREAKRQSLKELQNAVIHLTVQLEVATVPGLFEPQAQHTSSETDLRIAGWQLMAFAIRLADPDLLRLIEDLRDVADQIAAKHATDDPAALRQRVVEAATAVLTQAGGIYQSLLASDAPAPPHSWDGVRFFPV